MSDFVVFKFKQTVHIQQAEVQVTSAISGTTDGTTDGL